MSYMIAVIACASCLGVGVLVGMGYIARKIGKTEAEKEKVKVISILITENSAGRVCVETDADGMEGTNSHAIMMRMLDAVLHREYRQVNEEILH